MKRRLRQILSFSAACFFAGVCLGSSGHAAGTIKNKIICMAGCPLGRGPTPRVVDVATLAPTRALYLSRPNTSEIWRDVWCGSKGSCIALNHIALPHHHDSEVTISVFHYYNH